MKRRPAKPDYKAEAREMSRYGVAFSFDLRKKLSPQAKSAITRKRHRLAGYLNPDNNFKFVEAKTKTQKRTLARLTSRDQRTKRGAFIQLPRQRGRNRKKQTVTLDKKGELRIRTGQRESRFVKVSGKIIRSESIEELRKKVYRATKGKKVAAVRLLVRGYRGKQTFLNLKDFFAYFKEDLLPELDEEDEDEETDLEDLFTVEIVIKK